MKVWFDILTPKQLIFFKAFSEYLEKQDVECILTSRNYGEVSVLAKLHGVKLLYCGKYGKTKSEKLGNSIIRMKQLVNIISNERPDIAINCCSPDACRVAYGLGVPLILLNDTPHAEITNRLTMPLADRVWAPMIFKKSLFTKYGLKPNVIKHYNCIDAFITSRHKSIGKAPKRPYVLFRMPEMFASYYNNIFDPILVLKELKKLVDYRIVVLCRYNEQIRIIKDLNDANIIPTLMKNDGKVLYENAEFFVGGGGTMSAEAVFCGVPTIVYDMLSKNYVVDYLTKHNVMLRVKNLSQFKNKVRYVIEYKDVFKERIKDVNNSMVNPFSQFYDDMRKMVY